MTERWRPVVGDEDRYEVSDHGRVRAVEYKITKRSRWGTTSQFRQPPRVMRLTNRGGYMEVGLSRGGKQRQRKVHQLVLEAFVGPRPPGMEVCHRNGKADDNRVRNLRWDTKSANTYDRVRHGTHCKTRITHCPRHHPLAPPNLDPSQTAMGRRSCWSCRLAQDDGRTARRRGDDFDLAPRADMYFGALREGWRPAPNATKPSCSRAHPLVSPNLRSDRGATTGTRGGCRACRSATGYINSLRRRGHDVSHLDVAVLADKYYAELMAKGAA